MKDKLRELAEWMRSINGHCADALTEILDAEGDGGADESALPVAWREPTSKELIATLVDKETSGIRAAFARPPAQPAQEQPGWKVPDGWRIVPIKATEKMRQEGAPHAGYEEEEAYSLDAVWAAMLSASPTPPKEK